jgi:hypothetical protein
MKRRTLFALSLAFALGTLVGYMLCRRPVCRRPAADPRTPHDLAAALEARWLRLRCVPDGNAGAVFLTETGHSEHTLALLHLQPPDSWRGTVHASPHAAGTEPVIPGQGLRLGRYFLRGDPKLLKRIAGALR